MSSFLFFGGLRGDRERRVPFRPPAGPTGRRGTARGERERRFFFFFSFSLSRPLHLRLHHHGRKKRERKEIKKS